MHTYTPRRVTPGDTLFAVVPFEGDGFRLIERTVAKVEQNRVWFSTPVFGRPYLARAVNPRQRLTSDGQLIDEPSPYGAAARAFGQINIADANDPDAPAERIPVAFCGSVREALLDRMARDAELMAGWAGDEDEAMNAARRAKRLRDEIDALTHQAVA